MQDERLRALGGALVPCCTVGAPLLLRRRLPSRPRPRPLPPLLQAELERWGVVLLHSTLRLLRHDHAPGLQPAEAAVLSPDEAAVVLATGGGAPRLALGRMKQVAGAAGLSLDPKLDGARNFVNDSFALLFQAPPQVGPARAGRAAACQRGKACGAPGCGCRLVDRALRAAPCLPQAISQSSSGFLLLWLLLVRRRPGWGRACRGTAPAGAGAC